MRRMLPRRAFDDRPRDTVQYDQAFLAVLHPARDDEDGRSELGNADLPIPTQAAISPSRQPVSRQTAPFRQIFRQLTKQPLCSSQLSG